MGNEQALIEAARTGSVTAFTQLVESYRDGLLRFLVTRTSSYADAEDALQDTLINAYRYLHSYDSRWRFSTWLYRIAINNVARMRSIDTVELGDLSNEEDDPLQQCIAASESENLWVTARRILNDEVYAAMWLRYVEDMSVNDISAILERSMSWTKVNLLRGRRMLDDELTRRSKSKTDRAYG